MCVLVLDRCGLEMKVSSFMSEGFFLYFGCLLTWVEYKKLKNKPKEISVPYSQMHHPCCYSQLSHFLCANFPLAWFPDFPPTNVQWSYYWRLLVDLYTDGCTQWNVFFSPARQWGVSLIQEFLDKRFENRCSIPQFNTLWRQLPL